MIVYLLILLLVSRHAYSYSLVGTHIDHAGARRSSVLDDLHLETITMTLDR